MLSWQAARRLALALPQSEERDHFGAPSFRVKGKIFAQLPAHDKEEQRVLVKMSAADQAELMGSDPETFSAAVPQWWGRHGWTYVQLATIEEPMLRDLLFQSWRYAAPKRLVAAYGAANK
jgi:hypothetical protein